MRGRAAPNQREQSRMLSERAKKLPKEPSGGCLLATFRLQNRPGRLEQSRRPPELRQVGRYCRSNAKESVVVTAPDDAPVAVTHVS